MEADAAELDAEIGIGLEPARRELRWRPDACVEPVPLWAFSSQSTNVEGGGPANVIFREMPPMGVADEWVSEARGCGPGGPDDRIDSYLRAQGWADRAVRIGPERVRLLGCCARALREVREASGLPGARENLVLQVAFERTIDSPLDADFVMMRRFVRELNPLLTRDEFEAYWCRDI